MEGPGEHRRSLPVVASAAVAPVTERAGNRGGVNIVADEVVIEDAIYR